MIVWYVIEYIHNKWHELYIYKKLNDWEQIYNDIYNRIKNDGYSLRCIRPADLDCKWFDWVVHRLHWVDIPYKTVMHCVSSWGFTFVEPVFENCNWVCSRTLRVKPITDNIRL